MLLVNKIITLTEGDIWNMHEPGIKNVFIILERPIVNAKN